MIGSSDHTGQPLAVPADDPFERDYEVVRRDHDVVGHARRDPGQSEQYDG